jgi:restriction system protein
MPVPDFQTVMLPFLKLLADGQEWKMRDVVEALASGFSLTDEERQEMLPSGQSKVFSNRVGWAKTHLKNAGLVDNPSRGQVRLSDQGRQVLAQNPVSIDMKFLRQYDGYRSFIGEIQSDEAIASDSVQDRESSQSTPRCPGLAKSTGAYAQRSCGRHHSLWRCLPSPRTHRTPVDPATSKP